MEAALLQLDQANDLTWDRTLAYGGPSHVYAWGLHTSNSKTNDPPWGSNTSPATQGIMQGRGLMSHYRD